MTILYYTILYYTIPYHTILTYTHILLSGEKEQYYSIYQPSVSQTSEETK